MELPRRVITRTAARLHPNHLFYDCKCGKTGCQFCDGGLAHCVICDGFEGTLTTECPGIELGGNTKDQIYNHGLDFKDGRWVRQA